MFPDPLATTTAERVDTPPLRLTLADPAGHRAAVARLRIADALSHLVVVLAFGGVLFAVSDFSFWTASGTIALIWYPVVTAVCGERSPRGLLQSWLIAFQNASAPQPLTAARRRVPETWLPFVGFRGAFRSPPLSASVSPRCRERGLRLLRRLFSRKQSAQSSHAAPSSTTRFSDPKSIDDPVPLTAVARIFDAGPQLRSGEQRRSLASGAAGVARCHQPAPN